MNWVSFGLGFALGIVVFWLRMVFVIAAAEKEAFRFEVEKIIDAAYREEL